MTVEQLDTDGRWWQIGPWQVDLNAEDLTYPPHVRACALAHRDGTDDHGRDIAALATGLVDGTITDPTAERAVNQWLFEQSQTIVRRLRAHIARSEEGEPRDRAA
jgi:hypothetical protein